MYLCVQNSKNGEFRVALKDVEKTKIKLFMKKVLLIAIVALVAMTGCKKQSELSMESISGKATLTGTVYYAPGKEITKRDGVVIKDDVPAANQKLVVAVPYSEYQSGAKGEKYFETTIGSDGGFSISIPVSSTKNLSNYRYVLRPFKAEYTAIEYDENYEPEEVEKMAYFDKITLDEPILENGNTYYVGTVTLIYSKLIDINK